MVGQNTRRLITLVSATLTMVGPVIAFQLQQWLSRPQSLGIGLAWFAAGTIVTYLLSRLQVRSQEESADAIKERVSQLESELRSQVQSRSYGARRNLIEAPLKELDLDITPRVGWVRDPRLVEPAPTSERLTGIVAAFESSKRRLLIVGEPGSGKTMAAYSLIEHLDEREGAEGRIPLLVNLSAWEAQDDFESFLVDYLCSSVGYQVRERAVANAFVNTRRYTLILDGLDEIPAGLRAHFSERLDEFVRGLSGEVGVVVTCRTQEYEELRADYPTGLGLVQAVEILPLTDQQLDSAFVELAKFEDDWEIFLSQRNLTACQRVRHLLSSPLFLNLAVAGHLRPRQLLDCDNEQDLRDLVLDGYLNRTLADQRQYDPAEARRYLTWIARFLNGAEVSPFGLKTPDLTVFDLASLTPPDPPKRYRLFEALGAGLVGLVYGLPYVMFEDPYPGAVFAPNDWLLMGLVYGMVFGLVVGLLAGWPFKRSAVSTRLTPVWPSTRQQLIDFLRRAGLGLVRGLVVGLVLGLVWGLVVELGWSLLGGIRDLGVGLPAVRELLGNFLVLGLVVGLVLGLVWGLVGGLVEPRSELITSRTPKEASSRSLIAALIWLVVGLVAGLSLALVVALVVGLLIGVGQRLGLYVGFLTLDLRLSDGLGFGLGLGLGLGMRHGGGFVLLQKVAHRHLARAGKLPPRPADFLEWGIERQVFRRVGGGVRFRHNLIQQHLANTSERAA